MWIGIISLFPEMFNSIINYGITSKAIKNGLLTINSWNPRDFTSDYYRKVDDKPYGGGPGMLMMVKPLIKAINFAKIKAGKDVKVIFLSPKGRKLTQVGVTELVNNQKLILVCGRYKGIDNRVIDSNIDEEWSIGDYIISGGELAAMILIDSVSRLIPGVLGHQSSVKEDSFSDGLLEEPHYTRPEELYGMKVPKILLSGNHNEIRRWRIKQSLGQTWLKRPELFKKVLLNEEQIKLLSEFKNEKKFYKY